MSWEIALRVAMAVGVAIVGWRVSRSVLARVPRHRDSELERALASDPPEAAVPPVELAELERVVRFGRARAGDLHSRLRPALRALAAERLMQSYGIDLDREGEAAHRLLGDLAYGLLRADRPPPSDRWSRGIARQELTDVVDRLEAL